MNPVEWRTSSFSGGGGNNCVELAVGEVRARLRDSKAPHSGELIFSPARFNAFMRHLKAIEHQAH